MSRKANEKARGPLKRGPKPKEVTIRRDYRAFTVRLPPDLYDALRDDAEAQRRSVAAHFQVLMEEIYG